MQSFIVGHDVIRSVKLELRGQCLAAQDGLVGIDDGDEVGETDLRP